MNNVFTASRMNCMMHCLRKHYWASEIGLTKAETGLALRVGTAWHSGMEARWRGASYEEALAASIPEGIDLPPYEVAKIAAMLAAYYDVYGEHEQSTKPLPEKLFAFEIEEGFTAEGKIDCLNAQIAYDRVALIEHKTTGERVDPDSEFWMRLTFNLQVLQYIWASRALGVPTDVVVYDVVRKPKIKPREVYDLDADGKKVVLDRSGERVFNKQGKNKGEPRQSGDEAKGYFLQSHIETPDEFSDRLWKDIRARKEFYFARREVPILEGDLKMFEAQRLAMIKIVIACRAAEASFEHPEDAWPRAVGEHTCKFCQFKSFCLANVSIDLNALPEGYSVQPFNPELKEHDTITEEADDASA